MDKRISTLREVLFGIRVVKCYAWEEAHAATDLADAQRGGDPRDGFGGFFARVPMGFPRDPRVLAMLQFGIGRNIANKMVVVVVVMMMMMDF